MTNADKIRTMSIEELAHFIPCPYDTAGSELMPCIFDEAEPGVPDFVSPGRCEKCILEWLRKEVE